MMNIAMAYNFINENLNAVTVSVSISPFYSLGIENTQNIYCHF